MNMIRHDHVAPERDIEFNDRATSVLLQSKLSTIQRWNTSAVASRKSDEVERLIDVDQIKSMRTVLDHFPDCRASRARCNHPVFAGGTPATTVTLDRSQPVGSSAGDSSFQKRCDNAGSGVSTT